MFISSLLYWQNKLKFLLRGLAPSSQGRSIILILFTIFVIKGLTPGDVLLRWWSWEFQLCTLRTNINKWLRLMDLSFFICEIGITTVHLLRWSKNTRVCWHTARRLTVWHEWERGGGGSCRTEVNSEMTEDWFFSETCHPQWTGTWKMLLAN